MKSSNQIITDTLQQALNTTAFTAGVSIHLNFPRERGVAIRMMKDIRPCDKLEH
jgi:hypothetical protein